MLYLVPVMIESMHCLFINVNTVEVYNKISKFDIVLFPKNIFDMSFSDITFYIGYYSNIIKKNIQEIKNLF